MPTQRKFLYWLRRTHAWLGLWGAALGFLFGVTGIILNHRHTLPLSLATMEASHLELAIAEQPSSAGALASILQQQLEITKAPFSITAQAAKNVVWNGRQVEQPALWKVDFHHLQHSITAEYWVGNQFVSIHRQDANAVAFFTRMHKGVGMNIGWILLIDSLGGALMMLTITGVLLWSEMRRSRLVIVGLSGTSILLALLFTAQSLNGSS